MGRAVRGLGAGSAALTGCRRGDLMACAGYRGQGGRFARCSRAMRPPAHHSRPGKGYLLLARLPSSAPSHPSPTAFPSCHSRPEAHRRVHPSVGPTLPLGSCCKACGTPDHPFFQSGRRLLGTHRSSMWPCCTHFLTALHPTPGDQLKPAASPGGPTQQWIIALAVPAQVIHFYHCVAPALNSSAQEAEGCRVL